MLPPAPKPRCFRSCDPRQKPYCKSSFLNGHRHIHTSHANLRLHSSLAAVILLLFYTQELGMVSAAISDGATQLVTRTGPHKKNTDTRRIYFVPTEGLPGYPNCCLNNKILVVLSKLQRLCESCRAGSSDVAIIPKEVEEHGLFGLYNSSAIQSLKAEGLTNKCTFVTSEEAETLPGVVLAAGATVETKVKRNHFFGASLDGPFHCWMYTNLQVPPKIKPGFTECVKEMANIFGKSFGPGVIEQDPLSTLRSLDYTAVHVRIETDWLRRCDRRAKKDSVKWCFTTNEIAQAVREDNELASHKNFVLIHGDRLAKEDRGSGHPAEVWKRVLPDSQIFDRTQSKCLDSATGDKSSGMDRIIADLLVAEQGRRFLGHFGSTFSTGVLKGKSCERGTRESNANEPAIDMAVYSCPPKEYISTWKLRSIGNCHGAKGPGWGGFSK